MATARLEMNLEIAKVILESIYDDREPSDLVDYYFNHYLQILDDFYTALDNCLRRARDNQSWIQLAIMHFEEERRENVGGEKYAKTLQELQRFREAGGPFTDEFSMLFNSVWEQQAETLQKLQAREKLDKKVKSAQVWRRVINFIFVTAFVSALIFSVVAVGKAAKPAVSTLAAALATPIGAVGKWCNSWCEKYRKKLKGKKELIDLMNVGTRILNNDLVTIRLLVSKLKTEIESILQYADFALGEEQEEAVKLGMLEIKKRADVFMKTMEDLSTQADKSSREIQMARTLILLRIMGQFGR